jgi:hypothetical protein
MANNNEQFKAFHETIKAADAKRTKLRTNREAIRDKIRKYFRENHEDEIQPKFRWQGSYAMRTILNPIKDEDGLGVYDLDDGVYFIGDTEDDRQSIDWYHKEVREAVKDHTDLGADDIDPCVRVQYADGHHVDLAIYFKTDDDEHPQLAHRKDNWVESDPKEMISWFAGECQDKTHLRELVRLMKAWCEYKRSEGARMPSGCIMTMLTAKHYAWNDDGRFDIAMRDILTAMQEELSQPDGFHCYRPSAPVGEDLFANYDEKRKQDFQDDLKAFMEDAKRAIESKNPHKSCLKWQAHFGSRFCCSNAPDKDEDAQNMSRSGIIKNNSSFA